MRTKPAWAFSQQRGTSGDAQLTLERLLTFRQAARVPRRTLVPKAAIGAVLEGVIRVETGVGSVMEGGGSVGGAARRLAFERRLCLARAGAAIATTFVHTCALALVGSTRLSCLGPNHPA